jgi:hypothetical protein
LASTSASGALPKTSDGIQHDKARRQVVEAHIGVNPDAHFPRRQNPLQSMPHISHEGLARIPGAVQLALLFTSWRITSDTDTTSLRYLNFRGNIGCLSHCRPKLWL